MDPSIIGSLIAILTPFVLTVAGLPLWERLEAAIAARAYGIRAVDLLRSPSGVLVPATYLTTEASA